MSLIGSVDMLAETCVAGWAADDSDWARGVSVDVVINSAVAATVRGGEFREDLLAAGIGDGRKGFQCDPSAHFKGGRNDLQVRYAGTDLPVPRGHTVWVKRHAGLSGPSASLIAALESYYEFSPCQHICAIGEGAEAFERAVVDARLPFRRYTALPAPRKASAIRLPEKADLVVWPACGTVAPRVLKRLLDEHLNRPGLLACGVIESKEAAAQIRRALAECGSPRVWCESIGGKVLAFAEVGGTSEPKTEVPVLAHIHIPKCAGTSFRVLLQRHLRAGHLPLYVDDTYFVYGEETLRDYLLRDPDMRGFSSHHVRTFPRWLAGREMLYVTFLRDPIQQFVSYMTHIRKHYAAITAVSLLEAVPPDAPQLPLREFARWLLTQDRDIPFRENHNVNFFSRHSAPAATDRLAAAKAALEKFFFVGITERMEQSMRKLRALALEAGLDFPPGELPVENISSELRDDLRWIHPGDEVGSLLLRSVEQDRQLYDWAAARLNQA